jgi:hypothetical protein
MLVGTVAFVIVRGVLRLVGLGPTPDAKDVEIAVLRHQLMVLRRQVARPRFTPADRIVLATLAKLLPRERWPVFLVTPSTLLRWPHTKLDSRLLVRKRACCRCGRRMPSGQATMPAPRPCTRSPRSGRPFLSRRCLVPSDGFYEWFSEKAGGAKPVKQPFYMRVDCTIVS